MTSPVDPGPVSGEVFDPTRSPRSRWLLDRLQRDGRIDVLTVAGQLRVAPETIRRDLRALEETGRLQRVHGGAVTIQSATTEVADRPADPDLGFSRALWTRLPRSGTLLIGTGPSGPGLAQAIAGDPPVDPGLTVVTRSLDVAVLLSRVPTLAVYNLGGVVSAGTHGQEGDWALTELGRFRLDVAVLWPDGISVRGGLSASTTAAAAAAQAEVDSARRVLAVGDEHTVGTSAFVSYARIRQLDQLILPAGPGSSGELDDIAGHGVEVTRL